MRLVRNQNEIPLKDAENRKKLLALLHIAKKDLNWSERFYREFLDLNYQVPTAAALTNGELIQLIKAIMDEWDWQPKWREKKVNRNQVDALKRRINKFACQIPNGEKRLEGLSRKICRVDRVEWCHDINKLKSLLAALGNIKRMEDTGE